jgi:glucose/mannose-6-phosphate isomerase
LNTFVNLIKLINLEKLKKIDVEKMYQVYDMWPEIAENSYRSNIEQIDFEKSSHFVFAGMGGSGAIGDIFSAILSKTDAHVTIVKGYHLPKTVNVNSIVIITSVSGETDEALSILQHSKKIGAKTIVFSSGGKIEEECKNNNIQYRKIPTFHSPRASFTSFLYSMMFVLKSVLPIKESDIFDSIENLKQVRDKINSENISKENPAIEISEWINQTPVIYYPHGLKSVAIRFKNSLQENCKIHVIAENVIEACHNGIVSWDYNKEFQPILIRGDEDFIKTKQLWEIFKEIFNEKEINFKEIMSVKGNILSKLICLIYILDFSSIYLATKLERNPTPVSSINYIKKKLQEKNN